jgi:polysaccharide biosynthesis/export protein
MDISMRRAAMRRLAGAFLGLALCAGTALAQDKPAALGTKVDEYQIGVHDLIEISVFQVAELSRTVRVNSRGQISLPLIGAVDAGGLTAEELEALLSKKLADGHLRDPQVSIFIKEFVSQRVIIEGSVMKAGVYPLTGRTTLLQAIAMASGLDPLANENEVKVFRQTGEGARETLVYDLEAVRAGKSDDPPIKGNDLVVVEKSLARSTVKNVTDTIRGILSFGRY